MASWDTASDIRWKDIKEKYQHDLNKILNLNSVLFNYKKDNPLSLLSDKKFCAVIAQDLQSVMPEATTNNIYRESAYKR